MDSIPLVSIIITHWNAGDRTLKCINQFEYWKFPLHRIYVLVQDNASSDGSSERLKAGVEKLAKAGLRIQYNRLSVHPGLTKSINMALAYLPSATQYVMRLDNDAELSPNSLAVMVQYLNEHPYVGVVGPRTVYTADPSRLNSAALWVNPWGGKGRMLDTDLPVECDALLGAVMLARYDVIQKIGRWFDPDLYLFAEETEFSWLLRKLGYQTHYHPGALAYHDTALCTGYGRYSPLSQYLDIRNHVLVFNRMTSIPVSLIRNLNMFIRIVVRCLRQHSLIALYGFIDGIMRRPLNDLWWQRQISSSGFRRP